MIMQMSYVEETETTLENTKSAKERGRKDRAGERRALILTHMKEQTTTTTWQPLPRSTHFTLSRGEVGKVLLSTWSTIEAFFFGIVQCLASVCGYYMWLSQREQLKNQIEIGSKLN